MTEDQVFNLFIGRLGSGQASSIIKK
jgi:hypothetical protein